MKNQRPPTARVRDSRDGARFQSVYHAMTALLTMLRRGNDTDLEIEEGKVIRLTEVSRVGPLIRIEGVDAEGHAIVVVRHFADLDALAAS